MDISYSKIRNILPSGSVINMPPLVLGISVKATEDNSESL
jgi:hypothetical protein